MSNGQFDDALENGRDGHNFIDHDVDPTYLEWSEPDSNDEDDLDEEAYADHRVEDEDWENAERGECRQTLHTTCCTETLLDFTKQFNRLRQHHAVRSGNAQGVTSSINSKASVATLPAVNHPRAAGAVTSGSRARDQTTDQLTALSKYSARLRGIDTPLGVGVNRKGPSASANIKDKSDRATNEQVLDPRTRLILYKMIGRGLVHEVNGCVSTGKEVLWLWIWC